MPAAERTLTMGSETEYSVTGFREGKQLLAAEVSALLLNVIRRQCEFINQIRGNGIFTVNGFRIYDEINGHPEVCTGEVRDPREAALYDKVGERILLLAAARMWPEYGIQVRVFKHNVGAVFDHVSFGHHESYRCFVPPHEAARYLLPHFATRSFYAGSGCLRHHSQSLFSLSQRAIHIVDAISPATEGSRPLYCDRIRRDMDEFLGPGTWYRAHQVSGDSHRLCFAEYLMFATTGLIYDMLNHGFSLAHIPELTNPVEAFQQATLDPTGRVRLPLKTGGSLSPLEMQSAYCAAAEAYVQTADAPPWGDAAVHHWRLVLDELAEDPSLLADRLDAYHKLSFIQRQLERADYSWETARLAWHTLVNVRRVVREDIVLAYLTDDTSKLDPQCKSRLDLVAKMVQVQQTVTADHLRFMVKLQSLLLEFHELGGWCDDLSKDGLLDMVVVSEADLERGLREPPQGTRAAARSAHIHRLQSERRAWRAGWDRLENPIANRWIDLSDPLDLVGQEHTGATAETAINDLSF